MKHDQSLIELIFTSLFIIGAVIGLFYVLLFHFVALF